MKQRSTTRLMTATMMMAALFTLAATPADARRGGSFGSRGSRTYSAPRATYGSQRYVAPVERTMTPRSQAQAAPNYGAAYGQTQPYRSTGSRFGGFGGGLVGGLIAGGLIGHFFGHGTNGGWGAGGSGGGLLATLVQLAIVGGIVWLILGFFRRRRALQSPAAQGSFAGASSFVPPAANAPSGGNPSQAEPYAADTNEIQLTQRDQDAFERLLIDVQDAFGREDYARLRQLTTPEIMSYLSEELSQNATRGLRNDVTATRLIDGEVSEAWREASGEYATIVMRYESIDVMRNRSTSAIVGGSATSPTETTELWTFVRVPGDAWKLSAIQES